MRKYEQPMRTTTPREDLERERQQIAAETKAFLARGGTVSRPEPRQIRAVPNHGAGSNSRIWSTTATPPNLSSIRPSNTTRKRQAQEENRG